MTFCVENETKTEFPFDPEQLAGAVAEAVLEAEGCPYEAEVHVLITEDETIRQYNARHRGIDRPTDVLSFPNLEFERPGDFGYADAHEAECFEPDTGELILGDIVLSADRVLSQAEEYGHSVRREFAFLVAHSMLHLCGYDHMEEADRVRMEEKQEEILRGLGITREELPEA